MMAQRFPSLLNLSHPCDAYSVGTTFPSATEDNGAAGRVFSTAQ